MQIRKTHFEQVPIRVAESALRLQTSRPRIIAQRKPVVKESRPDASGPKTTPPSTLFMVSFQEDLLTFVVTRNSRRREESASPKDLHETNDMDQNHANGGLGLL